MKVEVDDDDIAALITMAQKLLARSLQLLDELDLQRNPTVIIEDQEERPEQKMTPPDDKPRTLREIRSSSEYRSYLGDANTNSIVNIATPTLARWTPYRHKDQSLEDFVALCRDPYTMGDKEVVAVKWLGRKKGQKLCLEVVRGGSKVQNVKLLMCDAMQDSSKKYHLFSEIPADHYEVKTVEYRNNKVVRLLIDADKLCDTMKLTINQNLLTARIQYQGKKNDYSAVTEVPLHLMQQKMVLLLPGVLATQIHVLAGENKLRTAAWIPRLSKTMFAWVPGKKLLKLDPKEYTRAWHLELLRSGEDGEPLKQSCDLRFLTKPGLVQADDKTWGPYFTLAWERHINQPLWGKTPLRCNGRKVRYVVLQECPYDWRRYAPTLVKELLADDDGKVVPQYEVEELLGHHRPKRDKVGDRNPHVKILTMHSIQKFLRVLRHNGFPFLDDKVGVAGHSTGGVLLNGLIRDSKKTKDLIDFAFFIGTPFFGATKAVAAFLTGEMDLGPPAEWIAFSRTVFTELASDCPVIYHLLPSAESENHEKVLKIIDEKGNAEEYEAKDLAKKLPDVIKFMQEKRTFPHHDALIQKNWNKTLGDVAAKYNSDNAKNDTPLAKERIRLYFSRGSKSTRGMVVLDKRKRKPDKKRFSKTASRYLYTEKDKAGDETVPRYSLEGPKDLHACHKELKARCDHVAVINQKELWADVSKTILEQQWDIKNVIAQALDDYEDDLEERLIDKKKEDDDDDTFYFEADDDDDEDDDDDDSPPEVVAGAKVKFQTVVNQPKEELTICKRSEVPKDLKSGLEPGGDDDPAFLKGKVKVWCKKDNGYYDLDVKTLDYA